MQETTSAAGDRRGSANPTWSKTRQRAFEGGPPELAGRLHEGAGNGTGYGYVKRHYPEHVTYHGFAGGPEVRDLWVKEIERRLAAKRQQRVAHLLSETR